MGKLMLFFALVTLTQSEMRSSSTENQAEEIREYVYWDAFSSVFNKTADYWKAESAALEAESIAASKTGVDTWLEKNADNLSDIKNDDQCISITQS
jgi:hypothetical protein